jgi:hypothetical protein
MQASGVLAVSPILVSPVPAAAVIEASGSMTTDAPNLGTSPLEESRSPVDVADGHCALTIETPVSDEGHVATATAVEGEWCHNGTASLMHTSLW